MAAKKFVAALKTSSAADGNAHFNEFMAIVDTYIARYSPFEVNIEGKTKDDIFAKAASFKELSLVRGMRSACCCPGTMCTINCLGGLRLAKRPHHSCDVIFPVRAIPLLVPSLALHDWRGGARLDAADPHARIS